MKKFLLLVASLLLIVLPLSGQELVEGETEGNWWDGQVFYEIFVRSFYDSDGDGIGDIQGIIQQLDYLNDGDPTTTDDLGITGIWLMPISPATSYHGYDVLDYRGINPEYGTMADFEELLAEAEARGISIVVDLVINHSARNHEWFLNSREPGSPFEDWYVWSDEDPGYPGPDGQNVWHPFGGRYYYGVFWQGMPDLNYENPEVTEEMYDIARFWLEDVGVAGFRLDAIKFIIADGRAQENTRQNLTWMADFHDHVESVAPDALLVGEVWSNTGQISRYVDEQVDIAFEFDLAEAIIRTAQFGTTGSVLRQLETVYEAYPDGQYATFLTNHDQNRIMSQVAEDMDAATNAASLLLTLPGVPFVYYGEEIGMTGIKPDEDIRLPMQWTGGPNAGFTTGTPWRPPAFNVTTVNVAAQDDDPDSLLNHYRGLIQARGASEAMRRGGFALLESSERRMLAYLREYDGQAALVVLNLDDEPIESYTLTLAASGMTAVDAPTLLLGAGEVTAPTLNDTGGFTDYTPVATLPPTSATIIQLSE